MEYKKIFSFDLEWNFKTVGLFVFLIGLPNLLGMINLSTPFGFKIHFFQLAVIMAAVLFGPVGGLLSGLVGSIFSSIVMHNPYLIIGNAILGFFVGFFLRYNIKLVYAVILAFFVQLPYLIFTDYFFVNLSVGFITTLVMALFFSNMIWAALATYLAKPIKKLL